MAAKNHVWDDLLKSGFNKIDSDMQFLALCLREVLQDLGDAALANLIDDRGQPNLHGRLPARGDPGDFHLF